MDLMPIFPLGLVIMPGEFVNLHIFEMRYRQLIHEADTSGLQFGIPYAHNIKIEICCPLVRLSEIVKVYDDGRMDITVESIGLTEISEFFNPYPNRLYAGATYTSIHIDDSPAVELYEDIIPLLTSIYEKLNVTNVVLQPTKTFRTHQIIHKAGLDNEQELAIQKMRSEKEKATYLLDHLQKFIVSVGLANELKHKAHMNGHFKPTSPPL